MRRIFTAKEIKLPVFLFALLLLAAVSKAQPVPNQLVEKWSNVVFSSIGSQPPAQNAVVIASDGNIIVAGKTKIIKYSPAGNEVWDADFTLSPNARLRGTAIATDQSGNIYLTGIRGIDVNIEFGDIDILIAKYDSNGNELWSRFYNGPTGLDDESVGIGIDQSGNVFIAGNTHIAEKVPRIHTAKFNKDGVLQWAVTYNDASTSSAHAIAVDFFTGDVYVAGTSFVPDDDDGGRHDFDFTTIKYNANGEQQWVNLHNGDSPFSHDDGASAIAIDADGNVLVTGHSTEFFEDDDGDKSSLPAFATFKYERISGNEIWRKKLGLGQSEGNDFSANHASAIAIDGDDNVIVTGSVDGREKWATVKYRKSDGNALWVKSFDNVEFIPRGNFDHGFDEPFSLAIDAENNVYVTGYSRGNLTLDDFLTIKYQASNGNEIGLARFDDGNGDDRAADIAVDAKGNAYVTGQAFRFTTLKYGLCTIICPQSIIVNNETGKCGSIVNFEARTTGDCGPLVFLEGVDTVNSGSFFAVGIHNILVKSPSTEETCSFTITVVDNEKPVITECPAPLTVSCAANVPVPDTNLVKATDNCEVVTISHVGDTITNQTCANRFTLTRTYKATDSHGNTATCSQVITVNDIEPPRITDFSLSKESLWPPNHSMQEIVLNYQVFDNCVSEPLLTVDIKSNEPVNGTGDGDTDIDWIVIDPHHIQLRAERSAIGNGRIYTITVTADDGCNPAASVTKQVVVAHNITGPLTGNPFRIGSSVSLNGVFWDKPGKTHTAKWLLDGNVATSGAVTEPSENQNGEVSGSYRFTTAGVYKLQMNVTDQSGVTSYANTNNDLDAIVVIYDPNGGNAYGGGWFTSPAGALVGNPNATGKASYGFAANYKNAAKPKGETQFEFKVGSFEFNALNFDYLAINGSMAQFKGTGKINGGQSGIGFTMTVTDGALDGSGADKIRMKIYNRNTGAVIYDNQPGASDAALPVTQVGSNSVVSIQGNNMNEPVTMAKQEYLPEEKAIANGLEVSAHPNPAKNYFTISVNSNNKKDEIMLQVIDQNGRFIDTRRNIIAGSTIRFGNSYLPGAYYVRIMQGKQHKEIKLIKVTD